MIRKPLIAGVWAFAAILAGAAAAPGQTTYTWNGGGADANWSTAANWTATGPGTPPPASDLTNTLLILTGATRLTNTLDYNLSANSLTFDAAAGAFTVNGTNTLTLGTGGITVASNNNQTVAAPLALGAPQSWLNNGTGTFAVSGTVDLGTNTLTVGGTGAVTISGVVSNGGLTKTGANTLTLSGANTYAGVTTISGGVLATSTLANGGANSGIGASGNAAGNLVLDGGTLRYTGAAASTDRLFTLTQNGGTLDASGTGNAALTFSNTGAVAFSGTGTRTLTLTGTSTGANTLAAVIGNDASGATSLVKNGSGFWMLSGANTYTGTTTVSAGTLAVNRVTAGATPLGTGAVTLNGATLSIRAFSNPLTVTGFTQDVIASFNDLAAPNPFGTTSAIDAAPGTNTGFALMQNRPDFLSAYGLPTNLGLPAGGQFVSAANPATTFQMAAYDNGTGGGINNNSLYLSNATTKTGRLTLATPGSFQTLNILTTSGNGASSYTAVLHFTDGSTTSVDLSSPDWFNGNPFAITNLGRMSLVDGTPDAGATTNPRLYSQEVFLSTADQAKTLNWIDFTYTNAASSGSILNIFGVSGVAPGGPTSYTNAVTVTANSTVEMLNTGSLTFGPLSIGGFTLTTTTGTTSGTSLTFTGTSLTGNPTFNVAGGQTLTTGALDFNSAARTITKQGAGTIVFGAAGANATATNSLTMSAGTVNVTNSTALGATPNLTISGGVANFGPVTGLTTLTVSGGTANLPNVTAITTATVTGGTTNLNAGANIGVATVNGGTVNLGGASSAARLTGLGIAGTVAINNGSAFTIGSGNLSDTYSGFLTGNGSLVKVGTGTQTLTQPGSSYSGGTTVSAGKLVATRPGTLGTGAVSLADGATLSIGGVPGATIFGFNGNGSGWNLQGGPTVANDVLTLTTAANNQARSAWFATKEPTNSFTATFDYLRSGGSGNPADGMTFAIQNQSATALGGAGGSLGYSGISPSAALEVNIYNPNGRGIAFRTNGAIAGAGNYTSTAPVDLFNSGTNPVTFNLTYDGTAHTLVIVLTQGTNTFTFPTVAIDLGATVGSNAWVGFTGATGGENTVQQVTNFRFNLTGTTPPPVSTYVNAVNVAAGASSTITTQVAAGGVTTFTMGALTMGAGSTLNVAAEAGSLADTAYTLNLGATTLNGAATFAVANNGTGTGTLTLGALNDGGAARAVTLNGPGTVILGSAATSLVDGTAVNVNGGTLRPTNATALGTLANVTVASGATFSLGANQTVGALAGLGNVLLNGNTLTVGSTNNLTSSFGGVVSGTGGLTKAGTGTLTLSGANTYAGPTLVNAGTLAAGAANTLPSTTAVTVASGAVLDLGGFSQAVGSLAGAGNVNLGAGTLTAGGDNTSTTYSGALGGAGLLVKAGTGTLTLTGANTYTGGTTLTGGKLLLGATNTLPGTGTVTLGAGTTLSTAGGAGGAGVSDSAGPLKTTGSTTIELGTGAHSLTFDGLDVTSTGPLTIVGWTGLDFKSGTQGQLFFTSIGADPNTTYATWLSQVQFVGHNTGGFFIPATGSTFELTPVPEPGPVLAAAAVGLAGLGLLRRRLRAARA